MKDDMAFCFRNKPLVAVDGAARIQTRYQRRRLGKTCFWFLHCEYNAVIRRYVTGLSYVSNESVCDYTVKLRIAFSAEV